MSDTDPLKIVDSDDFAAAITKSLELNGVVKEKKSLELLIDITFYIHDIVLNAKIIDTLELQKYAENHHFEYEISRKWFATQPLILQVLALLLSVQSSNGYKAEWVAIAVYISVLLQCHGLENDSKKLLTRFKTAVFYQTKNYKWVWEFLPDITDDITLTPQFLMNTCSAKLEDLKHENGQALGRQELGVFESAETLVFRDKKINQLSVIKKCFDKAWYPDKKKKEQKKNEKQNAKPRQTKDNKPIKGKPPKLSEQFNFATNLSNLTWKHDDYNDRPTIQSFTHFLTSGTNTANNIEETVDNYQSPYSSYRVPVYERQRQSFALSTLDFSVMQNHISQRDLALNSNIGLLPEVGYKFIFNRFATDIKSSDAQVKAISSVLLLSMITACPVLTLLEKGYVEQSGLFFIGKYKSYLQSELGITQTEAYDPNKHLNEKDLIKIPLPTDLLNHVKITAHTIEKKQIFDYLKRLRSELGLSYLSISRIESALHTALSRYTDGSNTHIADLICRTPPSKAPAVFYSSHNHQELVNHYKAGLKFFDINDIFDFDFIDKYKEDFTTGSGFALSLEYVKSFVDKLETWVIESGSEDEIFDRFSTYVWYLFCILTGTRPNNGLTNIMDLDLESGWYLVDDKPNRSNQGHRIIPLCASLVKLFELYKAYLSVFDVPYKHQLSTDIHNIKIGNDITLLNLLSRNHDSLLAIKRGQVSKLSQDFAPFSDPYWTRHFVRVQLEKQQLNMSLINAIIGHERSRQQALGNFSSISKAQIFSTHRNFEYIAEQLGIQNHNAIIDKIIEIYPYAKTYLPT